MSLKLQFASLSQGASVDQQTGFLSVFEVVEEMRVPQLPMTLSQLVITLALKKEEAQEFDGKIMIHIIPPDGKSQLVGNGELRMPAEQKRMKALFRFGSFPILQYGAHRFVLSWLNQVGSKVGEAILHFEVAQATQVAQGVGPDEDGGSQGSGLAH